METAQSVESTDRGKTRTTKGIVRNFSCPSSDSGVSSALDLESTSSSVSHKSRDHSKSPDSSSTVASANSSGRRRQSLQILAGDHVASSSSARVVVVVDSNKRRAASEGRHPQATATAASAKGVSSKTISDLSAAPITDLPILRNGSQLPRGSRSRMSRPFSSGVTTRKQDYGRPIDSAEEGRRQQGQTLLQRQTSQQVTSRSHSGSGVIRTAGSAARSVSAGRESKLAWQNGTTAAVAASVRKARVSTSVSPKHQKHDKAGKGHIKSPLKPLNPSVLRPSNHSSGTTGSSSSSSSLTQPIKPVPLFGYMRDTESSARRSNSNSNINNSEKVAIDSSYSDETQPHPVMNAIMKIWEIQKGLKRGEMVQGVLQLGPRFYEKETCICAPVIIGRADGHLNWKGK